jgi:hypothetical protein
MLNWPPPTLNPKQRNKAALMKFFRFMTTLPFVFLGDQTNPSFMHRLRFACPAATADPARL